MRISTVQLELRPVGNCSVVKKSVVREFPNGQKVGIIGYVTPITVNISHPGDSVAFTDEIEAVREEAKRLQAIVIFISTLYIIFFEKAINYTIKISNQ